jgi:very-short-patch-repair endonuclease
MPEIIQFSNNNFYAGEPLEPLKQFNSERLDPLRAVFVPDGFEKGERKTINQAESERLVQEITRCCKDPRYKGKTMGVIVLKSTSGQAHDVERQLIESLGPEEMESRKLVCGDPYDFQGDERDIIFLSMVVAPRDGRRISALTGDRYNRPFNVATSRALEQMWLFHSVDLSDLSPDCLRYRLIDYFRNPGVKTTAFDHTKVFDDRLVEPFDSLFEQRVFLRIVSKGYRVLPQFEIAGYHIDLVVEGMNGRLAVECDGDNWHGADQYEHDMARQRQLERCGWTFWRVRESSFIREPDTAMDGLWKALGEAGIIPATAVPKGTNGAHHFPNAVNNTALDEVTESTPTFDTIGSTDDEEDGYEDNDVSAADLSKFDGPYIKWEGSPLPDPRFAPQKSIIEGLVAITAVEGPIQVRYLFRQYARSAGIGRVGHQIEGILIKAIEKAMRSGLLEKRNEHRGNDRLRQIVRVAGGSAVRLRPPNGRSLEEIPPSEIGTLMNRVSNNRDPDEEELFRQVLVTYGMKRITSNVKEYLLFCKKHWASETGESSVVVDRFDAEVDEHASTTAD